MIHVEPRIGSSPFRVGGAPRSVAVGGGHVTSRCAPLTPLATSNPADQTPGQIAVSLDREPKFRTLQKVGDASDVALTKDSLWVADKEQHSVLRLDLETGDTERKVTVDPGLTSIAADEHGVWVLSRAGEVGEVRRINPETMKRVGNPINVDGSPREIAVGAGRVWVTQGNAGTVTPIQP